MMKTKFFYVAALILGLAFTTTSCSSDDDNPTVDPANITLLKTHQAGITT